MGEVRGVLWLVHAGQLVVHEDNKRKELELLLLREVRFFDSWTLDFRSKDLQDYLQTFHKDSGIVLTTRETT